MSSLPKENDVLNEVAKVSSHLASNYNSAKELVKVINDKVPVQKKIAIEDMDEGASVKQNSSKLVAIIQKIKDFVEEIDQSLKENLSPEKYAKVAAVTATTEQVLDIVKTVTKGLVSIVGPLVTTIARKLKSSKLLHKLAEKIGIFHSSKTVNTLHEAKMANIAVKASHLDIQDLDHTINLLKPDEKNEAGDFVSTVNMIAAFYKWHSKTDK